jgi:hypothetical protein
LFGSGESSRQQCASRQMERGATSPTTN